jgi:hypothetical protein
MNSDFHNPDAVVSDRGQVARLLRQARQWFRPHPQRADAVSVEAAPAEVLGWMADTDHALLDEVADVQVTNSASAR